MVVKDDGVNAWLGALSLTNTAGALCDITTTLSNLPKRSKRSEGLFFFLISGEFFSRRWTNISVLNVE